jgi:alpha-methylacyl-CoA racemase
MTGFGQDGPLAQRAGHDINYIALSGVLGSIGRPDQPPVPPLNLVGDFGGGGMLLAVGVLAAILNARATGIGQDVDAAMVDGSALLMAMIHGFAAHGRWQPARGTNLLDSGAPFYDTYECADGRFLAVGAIEPKFFAALVDVLGLTGRIDLACQRDVTTWPHQRKLIGEAIATLPRDKWARRFAAVDACVTPVLDITEAPLHEHLVARSTFVADAVGVTHPAPAPRFVGTPLAPPAAATKAGAHTDEMLTELGVAADQIAALRAEGTVA